MRGPVGVARSKRVTVLTFGCVVSLGIAGCSNTISGTATRTSDQPVTTTNGSAYSVQNALATLPSHEDDEPLTVVTADLDAATAQAGIQRPTTLDDQDALVTWLYPLGGVPIDGAEPAPVFVPFAMGFRVENLLNSTMLPFDEEVGWSVLDAETFAERQTLPALFTVVAGDFDSSTFPYDLVEVADGVVTAGEGDDFAQDLLNQTAARPLGIPLRMALEAPYLAAARSTDEISAWLDGSTETLAGDVELSAVAGALDDAGVVAAVLTSGLTRSLGDQVTSAAALEKLKSELAGAIPTDPFTTVGIGWAAEDGEPVITVAYKFATDEAASDAVPGFEKMFAEAPSIVSSTPLSELYSLQEAKNDGSVTILTLAPGDAGDVSQIYEAMLQYDLPFVYE